MALSSIRCIICLSLIPLLLLSSSGAKKRTLQKRSFAALGCMGIYDKAKFARLSRVCEECYNLYRLPSVQDDCRSNCFKNSMFPDCVSVLLLESEGQKLGHFVNYLYGRKK